MPIASSDVSSMKSAIEKILNEYVPAKQEPFAGHSMGTFFRSDIPNTIYNTSIVNSAQYLITGSVGQGNWATVPWICIFDRQITTSATKGVYIVYLLERNGNSLYLTFNQGCTEIRNTHTKRETIQIMRDNAAEIASKIDSRGFLTDENIDLGSGLTELAELYQRGTVFYKEYKKGSVPDEKELRADLAKMMEIYQEYAGKATRHETGRFDSWEIIDDNTAIKSCDKSFFDYNVSGVPHGICWFFGAEALNNGETKPITFRYQGTDYSGRVSSDSLDGRRVRISWNTDLGQRFKQIGNKTNLRAKFIKASEDTYEVETIEETAGGEEEVPVSTKEAIGQIKAYIAAKGFNYNNGLIENFFLSLKSKPFVILAGTSGTGKTRLVKLFAEAIGAEYQLVPVRPDWSDSSDLFGHVDLNQHFIPGPVIDFIKAAQDHPNKPYFLCLDEMNLARVEYYLSDLLSVIETRDFVDGKIVSDALIGIDKYGADIEKRDLYGELGFPQNLYLVGTVNMDETTFPFSKKVLDRANTIEFNYVDLIPAFDPAGELPDKLQLPNSFLCTEYLLLSQCTEQTNYVTSVCTELQRINQILQKANAHIGYRVRDEIVFYMLNNRNEGQLLSDDEAFDNAIMQKILPRIQGSSASIEDMLLETFKNCCGDYEQYSGDTDSEKMRKMLVDSSVVIKHRKCAEKLEMMVRRFEEDGFTSYWL